MTHVEWLKMNIKYEKILLGRIMIKYGKKSDQYKIKLDQIEDLKN